MLIGVLLAGFALCSGVIAFAICPGALTEAAAHLDASDMLLSAVLLAVSAASATYSG